MEAELLFEYNERASEDIVKQQADIFKSNNVMKSITNASPCVVIIINKQRQAVYANALFFDLLKISSLDDILGKRPGEILNCIHAYECSMGCGTSKFCRECGAAQSIKETQTHKIVSVNECRVLSKNGKAFDFRVWTSPHYINDTDFTIFSLVDIADEKRRYVLEKTFFHDINNISTIISGYSQLLLDKDKNKSYDYIKKIKYANKQLVDELRSHQRLLQAESGELVLNLTEVSSYSIIQELQELYSENMLWQNRKIYIDEQSADLTIITDNALLFRILNNMLKNALEASEEGEEIKMSCFSFKKSIVFTIHNDSYMTESIQYQIFNRSFSTKGKGRGIGTYSMKLFGEKFLNGKVWFSSSKSQGTTFFISIPLEPQK